MFGNDLEAYLWEQTNENQISYQKMWQLINCESRWNEHAIGDSGFARNLLQFHRSTFTLYKNRYGWPELDYENPRDQIMLASKMIADGKSFEWTCAKRIKSFADKI